MDSTEPAQDTDPAPSDDDESQSLPTPVAPPPSTMAAASTQLDDSAVSAASSGPVPPEPEDALSHTNAPSLSTVSVNVSSQASIPIPSGQAGPCAVPCSHPSPVGCSCPSGVVAAYLLSAEEGTSCGCSSLRRSALKSPPPPASVMLPTDCDRPGPSGLPSQRADVPAAPSPGPPPPPAPGAASERAPCRPVAAAAAAAQPCHVLSLPDVRRPRPDCEAVLTAPPRLSPTAAASSEPTTRQTPAPRPSVSSGIRAALQSVASHTSFASPLSSIGPFCRICHEGESREQLISPCRCAGSVGLVHVSCIEKWLSAANKDSCEICMYKYVTERRPKPILEWLLNPSNPEDARNLLGDVICFFLLTALAVIAAYLCLMGASHYLSYKTQWEATGLVVLGLLISSIYCVWLAVTCQYHCRVWRDWRRTHQDVHLLSMKRISHSAVDLNNNNTASVPLPQTSAAGVSCRACREGSYSCSHCCTVCPVHGVQIDARSAAAAADDVFDDVPAGGGGGGGGSGVCNATVATMEDGAAAVAGK